MPEPLPFPETDIARIRRGVVGSSAAMILLRFSIRAIGFVSTLILVRLLTPADFGLVALVTVAYAALNSTTDTGLTLAIIRMETPERRHYDTAWTLSILRGFFLAMLIIILAPALAAFVTEPRVVPLAYILAGMAILKGFENIALVNFKRELQFGKVFWYELSGKVTAFIVTITLAILLRNYWALILGLLSSQIILIPLGYIMRPYRPRFSLSAWHGLFHFSKWIFIQNILAAIYNHSTTLAIGNIGSTAAVGTYQVANQFGGLPASEVAAPIRAPLFAGYSRMKADPALLRSHYIENLATIAAVITPLSLGIFIVAEPITSLILGPQWASATLLIRACALFALFDAFAHFSGALYVVTGHLRKLTSVQASSVIIRVFLLIGLGSFAGVNGIALSLPIAAALNMFIWNYFIPPSVSIGLKSYVQATWRTIIASLIMLITVTSLLEIWAIPEHPFEAWLRFIIVCLLGAGIHVSTQLSLWILCGKPYGAEKQLLNFSASAVQRLARRLRLG